MTMTKTLRSGTMPHWRSPVGRSDERRTQLLDVREMRIAPATCEIRETRNGDLMATGYASTFDEYEVYGGPENYGWIELMDRKAFNATMKLKPDVVYLVNHTGLPLARTKSETLKLFVDDGGLGVEALLEKTDPDVLALKPKMERGDVDEMSFAFYVKKQDWSPAKGYEDDPYSFRLIQEVSLHRGDVSVVTFGANPFTSAALSTVGGAAANSAPADNDLRNVDPDTVRHAMQTVENALKEGATVTLDWAGEPVAQLRERIVIQRESKPVGDGGAGGDNDGTTTGLVAVEQDGIIATGTSIDEARATLYGVITDATPDVAATFKLDDNAETISLADAKRSAGLDLTVSAARKDADGGQETKADESAATISLADARAAVS